jgi:hypothetical protein
MKELPVSDMSFADLIGENYLYADKTRYISQLIGQSGFRSCFLSRPRRFGKTLLLDTISELFQQNSRSVFKDLWIGSSEAGYSFPENPVIRLYMNYTDMQSPDELKSSIAFELKRNAKKLGIAITEASYSNILIELLDGLYEQRKSIHGNSPKSGTVILIDEYDSPITSNINKLDIATANGEVLHNFYSLLKNNINYIRFAMVTGITRFTLASLDSGPSNFIDISLSPEYAGICGFTISEFDTLFGNRMKHTLSAMKKTGRMKPEARTDDLRAKILNWYDGYNWLGQEKILNPYSILNFFKFNKFGSYWPETGTPKHLKSLVQSRPFDYFRTQLKSYQSNGIDKINLAKIEPVPILFHSGYLTIDTCKIVEGTGTDDEDEIYSFIAPNLEVSKNYQFFVLNTIFGQTKNEFLNLGASFREALNNRNSSLFSSNISKLLSNISYFQHYNQKETSPEAIIQGEFFYHGLIQMAFLAAGLKPLGEIAGADGRSDIILFLNDNQRAVIEIKYRRDKGQVSEAVILETINQGLDEACQSIIEKDYLGPHRLAAEEIIALGLVVYGRNKVGVRFLETAA